MIFHRIADPSYNKCNLNFIWQYIFYNMVVFLVLIYKSLPEFDLRVKVKFYEKSTFALNISKIDYY